MPRWTKISIIDICYAQNPKRLRFLYFLNEKLNKNANVDKI